MEIFKRGYALIPSTIAGGAFPWKRSIYAMKSPVRLNFLIQRMEFLARSLSAPK